MKEKENNSRLDKELGQGEAIFNLRVSNCINGGINGEFFTILKY
jgi:hypothetical protein